MGTGSVTRFPFLYAVLPAPVESIILCAEVRAGDGGDTVLIAETPVSRRSVAPLLVLGKQCARNITLIFKSKGKDTGTASVRS